MAFEPVVGQDAAQIRMVGEEHAEQVPDLALEPVGDGVDADDGGNGRVLVGAQLDPDALVVMQAQQIIDDVETLGAGQDSRRP